MDVDAKRLGRNIKGLRQNRGISQEALANAAKLKLSNLAKLEGGFNSNPTLSTLAAIARVLTNGSIDRLLRWNIYAQFVWLITISEQNVK